VKLTTLAIAALLTLGSARAGAQSWRTLSAQRPRGTADSLHVRVRFGAGTLALNAAAPPLLYDARARFDADQQRISRSYDAVSRTLRVGIDSSALGASRHTRSGSEGSRLDLSLARGIPLDIDLDLGASKATLDLSALWVDAVRLSTGATETDLTFGGANQKPMRELRVDAGVGSFTAHGLGNARAQRISVSCTLGTVDLDLGGAWSGDLPLSIQVVLGETTLRIPRDAGVALRVVRRVANLDADGFVLRDGVYYSPGYDQARRHVLVEGSATLATVDIDWQE
jgi:hypothetical protein